MLFGYDPQVFRSLDPIDTSEGYVVEVQISLYEPQITSLSQPRMPICYGIGRARQSFSLFLCPFTGQGIENYPLLSSLLYPMLALSSGI